MPKSVKRRLEELAWDVSSIGNFNYASQYGNTERGVKVLIKRLMKDFPDIYSNDPANPGDFFELSPNTQIPNDIDLSKIRGWENEVKKRLKELRSDPKYKTLLEAYRKDNQKEIAKMLPLVFAKPELDGILEPEKMAPRLYHGVTIPAGATPQNYLNLCLRIQREGLRPSPYGLHCDMDRSIRPIYFALESLKSHGLLSLSLRPDSKTVVIGRGEAKIYTKRLKADFKLLLRDAETLVSYAPDDDVGVPKNQAEDYVKDLTDLLHERKVPFKRISLPSD